MEGNQTGRVVRTTQQRSTMQKSLRKGGILKQRSKTMSIWLRRLLVSVTVEIAASQYFCVYINIYIISLLITTCNKTVCSCDKVTIQVRPTKLQNVLV